MEGKIQGGISWRPRRSLSAFWAAWRRRRVSVSCLLMSTVRTWRLVGGVHYARLALGEVDSVPLEGKRLSQPDAGAAHQQEERVQARLLVRGDREKVLELAAIECLD